MTEGSRGFGEFSSIEELMKGSGLAKLLEISEASEAQRALIASKRFLKEYGPLENVLAALSRSIAKHSMGMLKLITENDKIFSSKENDIGYTASLDENISLGVIIKTGHALLNPIKGYYSNCRELHELYHSSIRRVFTKSDLTLGDIEDAVESLDKISRLSIDQISGILEYQNTLVEITKELTEYGKYLKNKYQLGKNIVDDNQDLLSLLMRDNDRNGKPSKPSMKIELVNGNSVLTDLLLGISDMLPTYEEKRIPVNGKKAKKVRQYDEFQASTAAEFIAAVSSHKEIYDFVLDPTKFTRKISTMIQEFYGMYKDIDANVRKVIETLQSMHKIRLGGYDALKPVANPTVIAMKIERINYLAIRPLPEEVQPRTRIEKDFSAARRELLSHLKDIIEGSTSQDQLEANLEDNIKKAIELKDKQDDILRSNRDLKLKKDILDDNEFYIGVKGRIGDFTSEREPAPNVKYDDVFGASYTSAREHVEEVIDLATLNHLMKATAPRGKIKSNILLIGPYGCGKSEFARAVAADKRVIGLYVSVSDILTAYMHESPNNVKRVYDEAKRLRQESRYTKPVALILDEFNSWFESSSELHKHADDARIQMILQEVMDGLVDYDGIFTVAMTNKPAVIPDAILRRFKHVDIVGQLTEQERGKLFKKFLNRGMPIADDVTDADYNRWAVQLENAPGDVIGKVADEVHFKYFKQFRTDHQKLSDRLNAYLKKAELNEKLSDRQYEYVKAELAEHGTVSRESIDGAMETMLKLPQIIKTVTAAKNVYRDAEKIMAGLSKVDGSGFGFNADEGSKLWSRDR
jgi:SpoVK/Ycf46/Vps4 family AAA+-type ATPase